jgi:hypothetical protein
VPQDVGAPGELADRTEHLRRRAARVGRALLHLADRAGNVLGAPRSLARALPKGAHPLLRASGAAAAFLPA